MTDETVVEAPPAPAEDFTAPEQPVNTQVTETAPEQIEDEPATAEEPAPDLPEVETSIGFDQVTGKHLVSVIIRHPDATVIAVNGRAVWEGNG